MNQIKDAFLLMLDTLMYIPLIFFCFIPVFHKIKDPIHILILKISLTFIILEGIFFFIYLWIPLDYAFVITTLLCIAVYFWQFQKQVDMEKYRLLFIFTTACLLGGFGYLIYHLTDIFLNPYGYIYDMQNLTPLFYQIIFESILILFLAYPIKKYMGWLVVNFQKENVWRFIWIPPMIFTLIFYYFVPYDNSKMYIGRALDLYIAAIIIFIVIIVTLYVMLYLIAYSVVDNQRMVEQTIYLQMKAEQYRVLQDHIEDTDRIRHDQRHQFIVISELLQNAEYEQAKTYLEAYQSTISKTATHYSSFAALNAILNHYTSIFQEENIQMQFQIQIHNNVKIEEVDICVLLGNLLENTLHACRSLPVDQRLMNLKIGQTAPHMIVLIISNSYSGVIQKRGDRFLSSRHKGVGQGLRSATLIAEKYNGFLKVTYTDCQFKVKVLLHV